MATMKSVIKVCIFLTVFSMGENVFSQVKSFNHSVKSSKMKEVTSTNKEIIRNLYENIMNNRKFELFGSVISEDYTNAKGEMGIEAFTQGIMAITSAFPDAKWTLLEIIAEGNKVFVKHRVQGTHKGVFQNISPTNKIISNDGMVVYKLENGKIISHQIQTDRLTFLQQLGVLPADLISLEQEKNSNVYFVDKFIIPKNAVEEFVQRMEYNRDIIRSFPGFIKDEVIFSMDTNGDLTLMTIAVWQNQDFLDKAKLLVEAEYKKIDFNQAKFIKQLNIKTERKVYKAY